MGLTISSVFTRLFGKSEMRILMGLMFRISYLDDDDDDDVDDVDDGDDDYEDDVVSSQISMQWGWMLPERRQSYTS